MRAAIFKDVKIFCRHKALPDQAKAAAIGCFDDIKEHHCMPWAPPLHKEVSAL